MGKGCALACLGVAFTIAMLAQQMGQTGAISGRYFGDSTPLSVALVRAIEHRRQPQAQRLFADPYAEQMFPGLWPRVDAALICSLVKLVPSHLEHVATSRWPGAPESIYCQTKIIDDEISEAFKRGVTQVVILGAGYDTRALRLASDGVKFFEVDQPRVQA